MGNYSPVYIALRRVNHHLKSGQNPKPRIMEPTTAGTQVEVRLNNGDPVSYAFPMDNEDLKLGRMPMMVIYCFVFFFCKSLT